MAIKIREKKIYWLSHIEQDKENQKLPFVLETEPI